MKSLFSSAVKVGLESFHPEYGKLLGVGKNSGRACYEMIHGNKRVLTSVKDGKVLKQVTKENKWLNDRCVRLYTTRAENFVNGDTFTLKRVGIAKDREFSIVRQDGETGNLEYFNFKPERNHKNPRSFYSSNIEYGNYDLKKGQFIEYKKDYMNYPQIIAGRRDPISGAKTDYILPNGSKIPAMRHFGDIINYELKCRLQGGTITEENLGGYILTTLTKLANKIGCFK